MINKANLVKLAELPHIDGKQAQMIVDLRAQRPFNCDSDLLRIDGITPGKVRIMTKQCIVSYNQRGLSVLQQSINNEIDDARDNESDDARDNKSDDARSNESDDARDDNESDGACVDHKAASSSVNEDPEVLLSIKNENSALKNAATQATERIAQLQSKEQQNHANKVQWEKKEYGYKQQISDIQSHNEKQKKELEKLKSRCATMSDQLCEAKRHIQTLKCTCDEEKKNNTHLRNKLSVVEQECKVESAAKGARIEAAHQATDRIALLEQQARVQQARHVESLRVLGSRLQVLRKGSISQDQLIKRFQNDNDEDIKVNSLEEVTEVELVDNLFYKPLCN